MLSKARREKERYRIIDEKNGVGAIWGYDWYLPLDSRVLGKLLEMGEWMD